MTANVNTSGASPRRGLSFVDLATLLVTAFVLQTGLLPYHISGAAAGEPRPLFGTGSFSFPDIVSNLFLYVPVGACFHWSWRRRLGRGARAAAAAVVAAAVLSGVVEAVQALAPPRVSSLVDLVCNVLGASVGVLAASGVAWLGPRLRESFAWEARHRPLAVVVKGYAVVLIIMAVMPFSFTLDRGLLRKAAKQVRLTPFASLVEQSALEDSLRRGGDPRAYSLARWGRLRLWSRWAAEAASFAVLAVLVSYWLQTEFGFAPPGAAALVLWYGGLGAIALSVFQIPVLGRGLDATDALFRFAGLAAGSAAGGRSSTAPGAGAIGIVLSRRTTAFLASLVVLYIAYVGVLPATFDTGAGRITQALGTSAFLPFFGYFTSRADVMFIDVIEKLAAYAVFAALLTASAGPKRGESWLAHRKAIVLVGVLLAGALECVQVFIPVRVVSLTDPILAACGCLMGTVLADKSRAFLVAGSAAGEETSGDRPWSAADAALSTLAEPREDAPREPSPAEDAAKSAPAPPGSP
ncbi:MAG: VanZ family protein [Planctomycetes bacterium]|nr:VanZ family protein [Planctomycetota bacterium]